MVTGREPVEGIHRVVSLGIDGIHSRGGRIRCHLVQILDQLLIAVDLFRPVTIFVQQGLRCPGTVPSHITAVVGNPVIKAVKFHLLPGALRLILNRQRHIGLYEIPVKALVCPALYVIRIAKPGGTVNQIHILIPCQEKRQLIGIFPVRNYGKVYLCVDLLQHQFVCHGCHLVKILRLISREEEIDFRILGQIQMTPGIFI